MILLFCSAAVLFLLQTPQCVHGNGGGGAEEDSTLPPMPELPTVGVCQVYTGKMCEDYLKDSYVFVAPNKTVQDVEVEISTVFNVFRQSK